jgi:hypothetical protein
MIHDTVPPLESGAMIQRNEYRRDGDVWRFVSSQLLFLVEGDRQ